MPTCQAHWEDEANNRRVAMHCSYRIADGRVAVDGVTPLRVSLLDEARAIVRELEVWTEGGRRLLSREAEAAGFTGRLARQIEAGEVHDVRHDDPVGAAAEVEPAMKA